MKVIVMGGAGDMGSRAVEDLVDYADVEQVAIGDCNESAAKRLISKLGRKSAKVRFVSVDANNAESLVSTFRNFDVVASALGPFYKFEAKLVSAAIEAKVSYASICDDWTAAEQVMNHYSAPARDAGVVVVTGLGASPGLTNLGIEYVGRQFDQMERIDISIYQPLDAGGGEAVLRHMLFIMSGKVAAFRNGERVLLKACSEERFVDFPKFGRIPVWNMGHAEPVTLPKSFAGIREVNFFMGYGRGAQFFVIPSKLGLFEFEWGRNAGVRLAQGLEKLSKKGEPAHGAVRVDIYGTRKGQPLYRMVCGTGQMRESTALSLSVGALLLGRGKIRSSIGGVYGPESIYESQEFLSILWSKGVYAFEDLAMKVPLRGLFMNKKLDQGSVSPQANL